MERDFKMEENKYEIKIDLPGLLKLLSANIYSEPDVAVREMIQNAHDTCIIRKTGDKGFAYPEIRISYDLAAKTLTFDDNGAGMTEDELHDYLSTIGKSFTRIHQESLRGAGAEDALLLIGQFGIGLLSAFSVASKVEIFTRSYKPDSSGFKWVCEGNIRYMLEPAEVSETGTRVVLYLTDKNLALLEERPLQQIVRKYADFLSVPIYLRGKQVNSCTPPWLPDASETDNHQIGSAQPWFRENRDTNYTEYIMARYNLAPLAFFPFRFSDPISLDGLLFVPMLSSGMSRDFGELDIYISRMFIKANDKALLPRWAGFIKGIINTTALTPTLGRDKIVSDENFDTARAILGQTILNYLSYLENQHPELLDKIVVSYNNTIKASCMKDDGFFDKVCDLVRVSTDADAMSMKEYLNKSEGVIYFFSEQGRGTQYKILFAHKGFPFIDASWGLEKEFLEKYSRRKGVDMKRLETGSEAIFKELEPKDEKWQDLERQFTAYMGKEAKTVMFEPETFPAILASKQRSREEKKATGHIGRKRTGNEIMQRYRKTPKGKSGQTCDETMLYLNAGNPAIQQLCDMQRNETFIQALTAIYNNASLFANHYVSPENIETLFTGNNDAISTMIKNARALEDAWTLQEQLEEMKASNRRLQSELDNKIQVPEPTEYRSCFFAYPFQKEFHALRKEIARILADKYDIRLMSTSIEMRGPNIVDDIKGQIAISHFGIADITGNDPNVLWELGLMNGYGKPVIIIKKQSDTADTPYDLMGNYRVEYLTAYDDMTGSTEYSLLKDGLERNLNYIFKKFPKLEQAARWSDEDLIEKRKAL